MKPPVELKFGKRVRSERSLAALRETAASLHLIRFTLLDGRLSATVVIHPVTEYRAVSGDNRCILMHITYVKRILSFFVRK
jgi:hypothetical protein